MHLAPSSAPKFPITIVSNFSWVLQSSQEKLKTMVMQNIGGANKMQDGLCENRELAQCDSNISIDVNPRSQINPRQRVLKVQF